MSDTILTLQQEIDSLKKERQVLHESQLRFTTIFENSRLGNKIIGPDLKILNVNPALVALLGYDSKEQLIGTKIIDYAPADHHEDWTFLYQGFSVSYTYTLKDINYSILDLYQCRNINICQVR